MNIETLYARQAAKAPDAPIIFGPPGVCRTVPHEVFDIVRNTEPLAASCQVSVY